MSGFNGANGGERPAGTAQSLVLHWVDGTLIDPIDGLWAHRYLVSCCRLLSLNLIHASHARQPISLLIGPVRELIVAHHVRLLFLIVPILNKLVNFVKELHSELQLILGRILFAERGNIDI